MLEMVEEAALRLRRIVVPRGRGTSKELGSAPSDEEDRRGLNARRAAIIRKVSEPQHYRVLMVGEATLYFQVTSRTIYRWV